MNAHLDWIDGSLRQFGVEFILIAGIVTLIVSGLWRNTTRIAASVACITFALALLSVIAGFDPDLKTSASLFHGMLRSGNFSSSFKILFLLGGMLTVLMSFTDKNKPFRAEYYTLITALVLGACVLAMSTNFIMMFVSLELISISSYVLAGFSFDKKGAEGSLKYFLFGSVASAIMVYGFSILYGFTGSMEVSGELFLTRLETIQSPLILIASIMVLGGFLFKIVAFPMHPWSPDVYEAAPVPVIALFSVVPKLAGLTVFIRFVDGLNHVNDRYDWQLIVAVLSVLTITVGNFSALLQKNAKRMMAYSSIAQAGFLLAGVAAFSGDISFILFYAGVYLVMNFLVFIYIQYFERIGIVSIEQFSGIGRFVLWPSVFLLLGFVALTGLPPTAGFTAKLFLFTSVWRSYELYEKGILLVLLIFGLLNTVVSLFFYLKIPYYAFLKTGEHSQKQNNLTFENLLGFVLVLLLLALFFQPGLLMGWINRFIFVP